MKYMDPLWRTFRSLKGNQWACVIAEPLWAIPSNLFLPFASVYMAAVGLKDSQIGVLVSFGFALQLVWGLLSGSFTDKYGRRRMMLIFGLLSWVAPCLLWGMARGYFWFLAAVCFNSMQMVIQNCFSCLIVEDGDTDKLVNIYTILNLIGLVAGFLSPLMGLCIARFTLIPTMRMIYLLSMLPMTLKFILQYRLSSESGQGRRRMRECRGKSVRQLTLGGWQAAFSALRQPRLLSCVALSVLLTCYNSVQAAFWPLFVTKIYGVSNALLSVFPFAASAASIAVYVLVTPRIRLHSIRLPLFAGVGLHVAGLLALLAFRSAMAVWAVFFSAFCEASALALLNPLLESILSVLIPARERARTNSLIFAVTLLASMPAGWIAGCFSQRNRVLPMCLNLGVMLAAAGVAFRIVKRTPDATEPDGEQAAGEDRPAPPLSKIVNRIAKK